MKRFVLYSFLISIIVTAFSCASTQMKASLMKKPAVNQAAAKDSEKKTGDENVGTAKLIENLEVNDNATKNLWKKRINLQKSDIQFSDRAYLVVDLPKALAGAEYIHTAADAKKFTGEVLATMAAKADIDAYVAHDTRIIKKPEWLSEWTATDMVIVNSEANPTSFGVFKRSYKKGDSIVLGMNGQSSGCLMYMVLFTTPGFKGIVMEGKGAELTGEVTWPACLGMKAQWYSSKEGIRVADNLLMYQFDTGGWDKNIDMAKVLTEAEKNKLIKNKTNKNSSTIDNNATTQQIIFLAKAYTNTKEERFKEGALKGITYLLEAQYPNGGWPQYYPVNPSKYYAHVTFNDNAMINVMNVFESILRDDFFAFIDESMKSNVKTALDKGLEAILNAQIKVNGKKTAWCAQHHASTLLPAPARAYELESISGFESIGIMRYLMDIENPSPEVIDAVKSAVAWFEQNSIKGIIVQEIDNNGPDRIVVEDPSAPRIWARFYDIETSKPFFCGRDGVKKENFSEIEQERRIGYSYYTYAPKVMLEKEYPAWQKKYAPNN